MPSRAHRRHRAKRNVQAPSSSSSTTASSAPTSAPSPSTLPLPIPHPHLPPRPSPSPTGFTSHPRSSGGSSRRGSQGRRADPGDQTKRIDKVLDRLREMSLSRGKDRTPSGPTRGPPHARVGENVGPRLRNQGQRRAPLGSTTVPSSGLASGPVVGVGGKENLSVHVHKQGKTSRRNTAVVVEDGEEEHPSIGSNSSSSEPAVFFTPASSVPDPGSRSPSPDLDLDLQDGMILGALGVKVKVPIGVGVGVRERQALERGSVPVVGGGVGAVGGGGAGAVGTPKVGPGLSMMIEMPKEDARLPFGWQTGFDLSKNTVVPYAPSPSPVFFPTTLPTTIVPPPPAAPPLWLSNPHTNLNAAAMQYRPIDPSSVSSVPFALAPAAPIRMSRPSPPIPVAVPTSPAPALRPVSPTPSLGAAPVLPPPSKMVATPGGAVYFAPVPQTMQDMEPMPPPMVSTVSPDATRDPHHEYPSRTRSPVVMAGFLPPAQSPLLASPFQGHGQRQGQVGTYSPAMASSRQLPPRFAAATAGSYTPVMSMPTSHPSPSSVFSTPGAFVSPLSSSGAAETPSDWSPVTPLTTVAPVAPVSGGGVNTFASWPYGPFGFGSPGIRALGLTGVPHQHPSVQQQVKAPTVDLGSALAQSPMGLGLPFFGKVNPASPPQTQQQPTSAPLPAQTQPEEARRAGKNRTIVSTGNVGPMIPQPGDWMCGVCQFINWNRRKVCMRCFPERNDAVAEALATKVRCAATLAGVVPEETPATPPAPLFKQRAIPSPIRIVKPAPSAGPFDVSSPKTDGGIPSPPVIGLQPPTAAFEPPSPYLVDRMREARDMLRPADAQQQYQQQRRFDETNRRRSSTLATFKAVPPTIQYDEADITEAAGNPNVYRFRTMTTPVASASASSWQAIKSLWS